jgi:hypothetical protein
MGLISLFKSDTASGLVVVPVRDPVFGVDDSPEYIQLTLAAAAVGTIYLRPEKTWEPFSLAHLGIVADPIAAPFTVAIEWDAQVTSLPAAAVTIPYGAGIAHPGGVQFLRAGLFWDPTLATPPIFAAKELRIKITNGATPCVLRVTPVILDRSALGKF